MKKIFSNKWIVLFLLLPFFKPIFFQYYTKLSIIEYGYVVWKIIAAFLIALLCSIYIYRSIRFPKICFFALAFEISILLSTIYNHGNINRAVIDLITIEAYTLIVFLGLKFNKYILISVHSSMMNMLMVINLVSIVIYPSGIPADLYNNSENPLFFMTIDNGTALFIIFCSAMVLLNSQMKNKIGKLEYLIIALCVVTAILTKSSTAIISILSFIFILSIELRTKMNLFSNWKRWGLLYGVVFIQIMFVKGNMFFSWIIGRLFNKTLSYTGRDLLWSRAYEMISKKPILGYGRIEGDYISIWGGFYSSHNFILELLLQGGVIAIIIFIYLVIQALKKLQKNRLNKITKVLWTALFITFVAMLMEANVHSVYLFGLLVFAYSSAVFED